MNEESKTDTVMPAAPPATTPVGAMHVPTLAVAALALLGVLILGWFAWQGGLELETTQQEQARQLAEGNAAQREALTHAQQNRASLDALQGKLGALEAQLVEMQHQQTALQAMYQELSRVRDDRLLAELEQDIALAAQQLQLAGNIEAAWTVLQGADARLAKSAQAQFLPLRKLIARDIARLKQQPAADLAGAVLKLDLLHNAVPQLPLAFEHRPAPNVPAAAQTEIAVPPTQDFGRMMRAWLGEVWHELRQLVRLERIDTAGAGDPGLLAPREAYFLRENLRLRLLSARLALLTRDGNSYRGDLRQAGEWLARYFDGKAPAVLEAQVTLKGLGQIEVSRAALDLDETLAAVRSLKLGRERGPAR